jgi:hypothetical protein
MYYLKCEIASHFSLTEHFVSAVSCCLRQFEAGRHACIIKARLDCAIQLRPRPLCYLSQVHIVQLPSFTPQLRTDGSHQEEYHAPTPQSAWYHSRSGSPLETS